MNVSAGLLLNSRRGGGPLPAAPTRDQVIAFRCSLQGIKLQVDGKPWFWWDPDITVPEFRNDRSLRQQAYDAKRAAGNTHIAISIDGSLADQAAGLRSLDQWVLSLMAEARREGFIPALFCKGDGVADPVHDPAHTDPGSCGYPWLMEHFPTIVDRVADAGLFDSTLFFPGFDGCNPAWGKDRCIQWLLFARDVLDAKARELRLPYGVGYSGFENSGGFWCWTGEHDDYAEPSGQALDVVATEYYLDYCVPDVPPPANFMSLTDQERAPWDCVYQIDKRILGPYYNRPADQPAEDDPGTFHGGPMVHSTPRGPFGVSLFEFDTYNFKRLESLTPADVERHRRAGYARGYPHAC